MITCTPRRVLAALLFCALSVTFSTQAVAQTADQRSSDVGDVDPRFDARHEVSDLRGRAAERNAERRSRLVRPEADALDYLRQTELDGGAFSLATKQTWALLAALNEDFQDSTFPPTGWAAFMTSGSDPISAWVRVSDGLPNYIALSGYSENGPATAYLVTPMLAPALGSSALEFKMWQFSASDFGSQFAVLVSTQSQTTAGDFSVIAGWNDADPCPGDAVVRTTQPASRNCSVDLSAYNGQNIYVAFRHINDFGDDFNLDDVLGPPIHIPGTPTFAVSPAASFDFGIAGTCTLGGAVTQAFTVSNTGGGALTVNAPTLSGHAAFSLGSVAPFPVTLLVGESQAFDVTFDPGASTGDFSSDLDVSYDDGSPNTATVVLSGTGYNPGDATGAGFAMRSNVLACSSGSTLPVPGATYIEPIGAGHVRVLNNAWTSGSGDDGFKQLDLVNLYPGQFENVRLFGEDHTTIYVSSNGLVTFDFGVSSFYGVLPAFGSASIQVAAMDLNISPTVYASDNAGVSGVTGVFYGLSDVDADSDDELVITYWHAYKLGSPAISNSLAQYLTAQLIVFKADNPNEDDSFEIRLFGGQDQNGVKYRGNFSSGSPSITNDIAIGVGERSGKDAAIYANGSGIGGALSNNGTHLGLRFQPQTQATAGTGAGWRMMGVPIADTQYGAENTPWGYTVGRLAELNLVQNVTGQYPTWPSSNVINYYDGTAFDYPANVNEFMYPGEGFLWYLYDQEITPDPTGYGGGSSVSRALPMALQATGYAPDYDVEVTLNDTGDKFTMVANPFREQLDVSPAEIATWEGASTLSSAVAQTWSPTPGTGSYTMIPGSVASAWQGFWIEGSSSSAYLIIPESARVSSGGTFVGRSASVTRSVSFELAGAVAGSSETTLDRAAVLYFAEGANSEWDVFDASKLSPMASAFATMAFEGLRDGEPRLKAQESRALDTESFDVPVLIDAMGTDPELSLTWPRLINIPADWSLTLRDMVTGESVDLRTASSYSFEVAPSAARAADTPHSLIALTTTAAQDKAGSTPRFMLSVQTRSVATAADVTPTQYELAAASPNPVQSTGRVRFAVPEAGAVKLEIYDLLGRRVSTLASGDYAAGWHTADIDASSLSAGVYVVRMAAGTFAQSQRVTIIR